MPVSKQDRTGSTAQTIIGGGLPPSGTARVQGTLEEVPFDRKLVAGTGTGAERFGSQLAVSGDVLVVTAPNATVDGKLFAGAADVFVRDPASGKWPERKRLVAQDGVAFDQLGATSVAVEDDTILLGASRAKVGNVLQQGAVYVFERHARGTDNWGQTAKLTDDSVGSIGRFGDSIAIQGDLLAVGATRGGGNGQVTLFERNRGGPGTWGKVTAVLDSTVGDGGSPPEAFGSAVALDGDLLLVGAESADVSFFGEEDGAAYLFRRDGTDRDRWEFVTRLTAPEATLCPGDRTLAEVSLESLEVRQEVERCAREDGNTDHDLFGGNVAIDGDTIVISAALAEGASAPAVGAVYVFRRDPAVADRWEPITKLTGSDILTSTSPAFGGALALAGDTLLVGAAGVDVGSRADQGAVYRFERGAGGPDAWGEVARLVAGDGLSGETFGAAVALDGVDGIIGASGYDVGRGAVYLAGDLPEGPGPAFPPTGELADASVLEAPGGVLLGAPGGALASPLPVWVHEVPAPAEPLSALATTLGSFYNIGAVATIKAPASMPFALALPVPAGADTAHLGVAMLIPAEEALDNSEVGASWEPISGVYDAESNFFYVALSTLLVEGRTVVLMQHPDVTPIALEQEPARSATDVIVFDVACYDFDDPEQCGASAIQIVKDFMREAYDKFVAQGFEEPALRKEIVQIGTLGSDPARQVIVTDLTFYADNYIKPVIEANSGGRYKPKERLFEVSYYTGLPRIDAVAAHEMFHAFQFGGPSSGTQDTPFFTDFFSFRPFFLEPINEVNWIVEGTAAAAEDSGETMRRSVHIKRDLHPVNRSLLATDLGEGVTIDSIAYTVQDFWVYFANKGEEKLGLGYLKSLFTLGADVDAAAEFFTRDHQTSLGAEYWCWVKNQAIEKTVDFDGALQDPCRIVTPRDDLVIGENVPVLGYPAVEGTPRTLMGTLPRLTAGVVRINLNTNVGRTTVTAGPPGGGLAYKVYLNGEQSCAGIADNEPRTFERLTVDDTVYAILANIQHDRGSRIEYKLEVKPASP